MGHIFISYSRTDKDYVKRLVDALETRGFNVWYDLEMLTGDEWVEHITNRIDACDAFIVVMTKSSEFSKWVRREVLYAMQKDKRIFPLLLQGDLWMLLQDKNYSDVIGGGLPDERFFRHLESVVSQNKDRGLAEKEEKPQVPEEKVKTEEVKRLIKSGNIYQVKRFRSFGVVGIVLLFFILGGFGLNSLFRKLPETTPTPTIQSFTETPKPPTETLAPFTPTLTETASPSPTPTTVLGIGSSSRSLKDDMLLLYVPAGEFMMGSLDWSQVAHKVFLDAYWIDQTEVTNAMYGKCVEAKQCEPPEKNRSQSRSSYFDDPGFANYPVVYVSWYDAMTYCSWVGRALPTEAQWEKAARGQDDRTYPWGENINCNKANYDNSCIGDTTAVGKYLGDKSLYGVYDLGGNVSEWVRDWYDDLYYLNSPSENPSGPENGQNKVKRGGSWSSGIYAARSYFRFGVNPNDKENYLGFRCSLSQ
ncbi:MAG: SUMF1/EgtB/PvdO family nonheme iron enzyme [Anaerolineales bacterium]|nr:SUMF1/EgtB/PvdO family nonheme iron enzyme [Anaerolineales bacterium]